jgi:hypothetical protein
MSNDIGSAAASSAHAVGRDVEFRLSRKYRMPMLWRFVTCLVLTVICAVTPFPLLHAAAYATGPLAVIFGGLYLWQGRFVTRVTGRGIEVHGYFNHFVPWPEVRGIEVVRWSAGMLADNQDYGGQVYAGSNLRGPVLHVQRTSPNRMARIASIKLVRTHGRKLRLRAPLVSGWASDPDFEDKARQLDGLCKEHVIGAAQLP